jgi:hypothetical protein
MGPLFGQSIAALAAQPRVAESSAFVEDLGDHRSSVWTRSSASSDETHQTSFCGPGIDDSQLWGPAGIFVSQERFFV